MNARHATTIVGFPLLDVEAELAKLDTGGWRPLRPIAPDPGLFP